MKSINAFKASSFIVLAAAASAVAVIASPLDAASKTAKAASSKHTMTVDGFGQIPTTPCTGLAGPAVTMELGEVLKNLANNGKPDRNITRKLLGGGSAKVDRPATVGTNWPTNLDMQLAEPDGGGFKPNDYVMVTINLQKARGAVFLRALSDPETASRYAVMVSLGSERHFCQRSNVTPIMTRGHPGQSVSFGMKRASGLQSINIAIMVPDNAAPPQAYWMPVIFDPMVKNEG